MSQASWRRLLVATAVAAAAAVGVGAFVALQRKHAGKGQEAKDEPAEALIERHPEGVADRSEEERIALGAASRARGNKYYTAKQFGDAIKCYTEAISFYPEMHTDLTLAYSNRAAALFALKDYEKALLDCNSALAINPKFTKVLDRRSRIFENMNNLEESLVDAVTAGVIDEFKTESLFGHVEELLKRISESLAKEQYGNRKHSLQSTWMISKFLQSFPREWRKVEKTAAEGDSLMSPVFTLILDEQFDEAYALLQSIDTGDDAEVLNWLGTMQLLAGEFEAAKSSLQKCIVMDSSAVPPLLKLSLVSMELGQYDDMTESIDSALRIDETDAAIYYHRGEILALSNNMEAAIADFARAIQLDAEFINAYVHQARGYLATDMFSTAKDFLKKALQLFPSHPDLLHTMGECLAMEGQYVEAGNFFNDVEKMAPNFPQVFLNKAIIKNFDGQSDDEMGLELQKVVEKFPFFDAAHVQLANYLMSKKRTKEAIQHYQIAAEHARSYQELVTIHTIRAMSACQAAVTQRYPELEESMQYKTNPIRT